MTPGSSARWFAALSLVALPLLTAAAAPAAQPVLVLDGRGYGHGVGMAQDSANAMAAAGASHEQILRHFYPGTRRGSRGGLIRVAVWEAGAAAGEVTVRVPSGARVSSEGGGADARPGAVLRIVADGAGYHVREVVPPARGAAMRAGLRAEATPTPTADPSPTTEASPSPAPTGSPTEGPLPGVIPTASVAPTTSPPPGTGSPSGSPSARPSPSHSSPTATGAPAPASPPGGQPLTYDSGSPVTVTPAGGGTTTVLATGRMYRGHIVALARQGFRLVDVLDIEQYLQGLGEVPAGWPLAALRTQAVAARTYALRAVSAGHPLGYDVCDDTRCQVYLGVQAESARDAQAARDTRGEVVTYRGALADTFYSANAGGLTATPAEGFGGSTTIPYLPGGLPAPGGVAPWRISAAPQDVARRLAYPGRLDSVVVTGKGPSGRVTRLRLEGAAGPRELTGVDAARRLGLRSTLFTVSRGSGTAQQLPAPGAAATQLPPAEAATALALPTPSPSASPSATSQASTARRPDQLGAWPVSIAAVLVALAGFGVVLSRRADLARPRTGP